MTNLFVVGKNERDMGCHVPPRSWSSWAGAGWVARVWCRGSIVVSFVLNGGTVSFGVVVVVVTMKWRIYLLWERMKETWDVTYREWVSRAELGQAELLEVLVVKDLLYCLNWSFVRRVSEFHMQCVIRFVVMEEQTKQGIKRQESSVWDVRRRFPPPSAQTSPRSWDSGWSRSVCLARDVVLFVWKFCKEEWVSEFHIQWVIRFVMKEQTKSKE